jgi:hypothetical protein
MNLTALALLFALVIVFGLCICIWAWCAGWRVKL